MFHYFDQVSWTKPLLGKVGKLRENRYCCLSTTRYRRKVLLPHGRHGPVQGQELGPLESRKLPSIPAYFSERQGFSRCKEWSPKSLR